MDKMLVSLICPAIWLFSTKDLFSFFRSPEKKKILIFENFIGYGGKVHHLIFRQIHLITDFIGLSYKNELKATFHLQMPFIWKFPQNPLN